MRLVFENFGEKSLKSVENPPTKGIGLHSQERGGACKRSQDREEEGKKLQTKQGPSERKRPKYV